jgi:hypothetical protein
VKTLLYHPEALGEVHAAPNYYYDQDLIEVGDHLVQELNSARSEISEHPHRWKKILENVRSYGPTRTFKWRIVYTEQALEVFVIAAYYGGIEDPLYWLERLAD